MRRSLFPILAAACVLHAGDGAPKFTYEVRGNMTVGDLSKLVSTRGGAGIGFTLDVGGGPGFIRFRVDGDSFTGINHKGPVETIGAGVQVVYVFREFLGMTPYVAIGPNFQHWSVARNQTNLRPEEDPLPADQTMPITTNRMSGRAQFGFWFHRSLGGSIGCLYGPIAPGKTAGFTYLALSQRF